MFWNKRAYFDYASATPLDARVLAVMEPYLRGNFANPSSLYKEGVQAKKAITEARKKVAAVLQSKPEEIIFTGGGTESNNLAILGAYHYHKEILKKGKLHFITTSIEHSSVLETFEYVRSLGASVSYISPEPNGIVDVKKIENAITQDTVLVSIQYVNNEIGTIQPIREIGTMLQNQKAGIIPISIIFHVDACQAGSYLTLLVNDLGVDLMSLDGSKIYGPKGSGILYKKADTRAEISPIMWGGGQEGGLRSGTEHVAGIIGFAEALHIAHHEKNKESLCIAKLRDHLLHQLILKVKDLKVNGDKEKRLPNNINICFPGLDAEYTVLRLDALGFAVSSVTSCKTLSEDSSSYVVEELYKDESCSRSSLRITLGRYTTRWEVMRLKNALLTILKK